MKLRLYLKPVTLVLVYCIACVHISLQDETSDSDLSGLFEDSVTMDPAPDPETFERAMLPTPSASVLDPPDEQTTTDRTYFEILDITDGHPHINREKIKFMLHTHKHPKGVKLSQNTAVCRKAGWKSNWPVKMLMAGYLSEPFDFMPKELTRSYLLARTPANIVVVDWGAYADGVYSNAIKNLLGPVSKVVRDFIVFLREEGMIQSYGSVHLIGHSLGCHLAGSVGARLKRRGHSIGRITGLDPAGPGFTKVGRSKRLDKTDATFVDVIHTDMPERRPSYPSKVSFGTRLASGHADFYPNGGEEQPGCTTHGQDMFGICSHVKSVDYYERTILFKELFPSCPCQSWCRFVANLCPCDESKYLMGEHCSTSLAGSFYMRT